MDEKLSQEEKLAIRKLQQLTENWPKTLWLFAAGNSLNVMRHGENGERVVDRFGSFNSNYVVEAIKLPIDGGDW